MLSLSWLSQVETLAGWGSVLRDSVAGVVLPLFLRGLVDEIRPSV